MSIEENRNCGCNNNMDGTETMTFDCSCERERRIDCEQKEEMLQQIREYEFGIVELALYLDTHPEDQKAICLHRKYCKELKELKEQYQKVYGPLTINFPCNKWRWLEEPWPWERGNF